MSTPIKGMATTKANIAKATVKADLKEYKEIKQPAKEKFITYVTTEPAEKLFDIRIGWQYQDEVIRGLRFRDSGNIVFEVPEKYVERFERQDRVKHGGVVKLNG